MHVGRLSPPSDTSTSSPIATGAAGERPASRRPGLKRGHISVADIVTHRRRRSLASLAIDVGARAARSRARRSIRFDADPDVGMQSPRQPVDSGMRRQRGLAADRQLGRSRPAPDLASATSTIAIRSKRLELRQRRPRRASSFSSVRRDGLPCRRMSAQTVRLSPASPPSVGVSPSGLTRAATRRPARSRQRSSDCIRNGGMLRYVESACGSYRTMDRTALSTQIDRRPGRPRRSSGASPCSPSGDSSTNTRRPSCGSARRMNRPLSVIVLIQRSAVVARNRRGDAQATTPARGCWAISACEQVEQHVPGGIGEQFFVEIARAQPARADDLADGFARQPAGASPARGRLGPVSAGDAPGPADRRARVAAIRLTSSRQLAQARAHSVGGDVVTATGPLRDRAAPAPARRRARPRRRRRSARSRARRAARRSGRSSTAAPRRSPESARAGIARSTRSSSRSMRAPPSSSSSSQARDAALAASSRAGASSIETWPRSAARLPRSSARRGRARGCRCRRRSGPAAAAA